MYGSAVLTMLYRTSLTMLYIRTSRPRALRETPFFAQENVSTGFKRRIKRDFQQPITPPLRAPAPHHAHTSPAPEHHGHHGIMQQPMAMAPRRPIGQQIPDNWFGHNSRA